ncbi:MAG: HAD family phosphatase [Bryobacterales bacterium]|nr:HAD family phosphatase [Bryobacterales bacterium]
MGKYDAVFFDFDGVLADTEPIHFACWRDILARVGLDLTWERYERECIGMSDRSMLEALAPMRDPPATLDELWPLYPEKKRLFRQRSRRSKLVDARIPEAIRHSSLSFAVVTSSGRSEVEPLLDISAVLPLLKAVVYGDDVKRLKPDPEPYLLAARRTGAKRPVVFEDSAAGIASGRAAGFDVIEVKKPADVPGLLAEVLS